VKKYKSVSEWAKNKIAGQTNAFGRSNYSQEFLEEKFLSVSLYDLAIGCLHAYSSLQAITTTCLSEKAQEANADKLWSSNIVISNCKNELTQEELGNLLTYSEELAGMISYISEKHQELQELMKLKNRE